MATRKLTKGDLLHVYDVLKGLYITVQKNSHNTEETDDLLDVAQEALVLLEEVLYEGDPSAEPSHFVNL